MYNEVNNDIDELDYPLHDDDNDPYLPKPTCTNCNGLGSITRDDQEYNCTWCGGTGCQR